MMSLKVEKTVECVCIVKKMLNLNVGFFFISVCVNGKNQTDEVSRGRLAGASSPAIAARMESQLEQQQIMKVGQRKVNESQRKSETERGSWQCILSGVLLDIIQFGDIRLSWHCFGYALKQPWLGVCYCMGAQV